MKRPPETIDRRFSSKTTRERIENLNRSTPDTARSSIGTVNPTGRRAQGYNKRASSPPDLSPVTDPLTPEMARHLLRRTGFGARPADVERLIGVPAHQAVESLVNEAHSTTSYRRPGWVRIRPPEDSASDAAFDEFFELNDAWALQLMVSLFEEWAAGSLRQRMTLFWHDHFSTSLEKYELASFASKYLEVLRNGALGDFKSMVIAVGRDPAMLLYLDGALNQNSAPNENYARELMELFTMGRVGPDGTPNYTEDDISEIARALTGWTVDWQSLSVAFDPERFDGTQKTVFGQTRTFNYATIVDHIFQMRGLHTAHYVCGKLFREFVHQEPDPDVIMALAVQWQASDFRIDEILKTLLKSRYFFDAEGSVGARIKSPVELLLGMTREMGVDPSVSVLTDMYWAAAELGQQVLFPPNVAGWKGHTDWLSTATLPSRWDLSSWFAYHGHPDSDPRVVSWANGLADPADPTSIFRLPLAMVRQLIPVPIDTLGLSRASAGLGGNLVEFPIPDTIRSELPAEAVGLASEMLSGVPWYEWDVFQPQSAGLIRFFLSNLVQRPEFQLM